ncbi:hypothetical protein V8C34DRAFT_223521 [Trichoderma compactum]
MLVRSILTAPTCSYERTILYTSCSVHSTCTQLHQNDMVVSRGGQPRTALCMLYRHGRGSRGAGNHGVGRLCKEYMDSLQLRIVGRRACFYHERETAVESSPRVKASLLHIHQRWIGRVIPISGLRCALRFRYTDFIPSTFSGHLHGPKRMKECVLSFLDNGVSLWASYTTCMDIAYDAPAFARKENRRFRARVLYRFNSSTAAPLRSQRFLAEERRHTLSTGLKTRPFDSG